VPTMVGGKKSVSWVVMCDYPWPECAADPLRDSGVYNIKTGVIMQLLSETTAVPLNHGGQCRPAWFFPAESM
jgi:hypothetical protein